MTGLALCVAAPGVDVKVGRDKPVKPNGPVRHDQDCLHTQKAAQCLQQLHSIIVHMRMQNAGVSYMWCKLDKAQTACSQSPRAACSQPPGAGEAGRPTIQAASRARPQLPQRRSGVCALLDRRQRSPGRAPGNWLPYGMPRCSLFMYASSLAVVARLARLCCCCCCCCGGGGM